MAITKLSINPGTVPVPGTGIQFGDGTALTSAAGGNNGASGTWPININGLSADGIPTGYIVPFFNASAPTNWTRYAGPNNGAFRVVSGSGGATGGSRGFNTIFGASGGAIVGGTSQVALSINQIASHTHTLSGGTHTHSVSGAGPHNHGLSETQGHSHGFTGGAHSHSSYGNPHHHTWPMQQITAGWLTQNPNSINSLILNNQVGWNIYFADIGASFSPAGYNITSVSSAGVGNVTLQPVSVSFNTSPNSSGFAVNPAGGGGAHDHGAIGGNLANFNIQYVDLLLCVKN